MTTVTTAITGLFVAATVIGTTQATTAPSRWTDTIPELRLICHGESGATVTVNVEKLRQAAKAGGVGDLGQPFVANVTKDEASVSHWEICAVSGPLTGPITGLQQRTTPGGPGAFELCKGDDSVKCAQSLRSFIRASIPDFDTPLRVIPILELPVPRPEHVRDTSSRLLLDRPDKLGAVTNRTLPKPLNSTDEQLFGDNRTPRPLLGEDSAMPASPATDRRVTAVLVYVPVTEAQRALLAAAK